MAKDNIPLIYLFIYKKMVERFGNRNQIILAKNLIEVIRCQIFNVPKIYDYFILKEMISYGMLEKVNSQKYKFLGAQAEVKLRKLNEYFLW